jgi:hypothetical protein
MKERKEKLWIEGKYAVRIILRYLSSIIINIRPTARVF